MNYNIKQIREDKTRYTWQYVLCVFVIGYLVAFSIVQKVLYGFYIDSWVLTFSISSLLVGIMGNIILRFKINVFNMLLYTLNRIILSIGFYISTIIFMVGLMNYIGQVYDVPFYLLGIVAFVLSFIACLLFRFTKRKMKKVMDKEEVAINIYDEWNTTMTLLRKETNIEKRMFLILLITSLLQRDEKENINLIDDKMKLDFIELCNDLLSDSLKEKVRDIKITMNDEEST